MAYFVKGFGVHQKKMQKVLYITIYSTWNVFINDALITGKLFLIFLTISLTYTNTYITNLQLLVNLGQHVADIIPGVSVQALLQAFLIQEMS